MPSSAPDIGLPAGVVTALALLAGCGGPLVGDEYLGTPALRLEGSVTVEPWVPEPDNPRVSLFWLGYDTTSLARSSLEQRTVVDDRFPAAFSLAVLDAPPAEALAYVDPETGARLGVAFVAVYSDENGNGMMNSDPLDAPAGPDRLIGASSRHLVAYATAGIELGSSLGALLALGLSPGYHLMESAAPEATCNYAAELSCAGEGRLAEVPAGTRLELTVAGDPRSVVLPRPASLPPAPGR